MLSISFSVFHNVLYLPTKQDRKNWLRSASNIFVTLILVKMASLRRNNVSQPISFISEETNVFVSTMLITDAIFQTEKNILNAVNSFCWFHKGYSGIIPESQNVFLSYPAGPPRLRYSCGGSRDPNDPQQFVDCVGYQLHVRAKFGWSSGGLKRPTGDRARVHRHPAKSMATSLIQGLCHSLLAFYVLFICSHQNILSQSTNQSRDGFPVFEPRSQGSFLCKGKSVRNEVKQILWERK